MTHFTLLGGVRDGETDPVIRVIKVFRSRDDGFHVIDYWLQAQGKGSKGKFRMIAAVQSTVVLCNMLQVDRETSNESENFQQKDEFTPNHVMLEVLYCCTCMHNQQSIDHANLRT